MAVTARFIADFSTFEVAVKKATVNLDEFKTSTADVEKRLNKMADGFSGRKLVDEANLMIKAVQGVGGIVGLTDKELQKIGTTAEQAAIKLERMGEAVPKEFQQVAAAAKAARAETDTWGNSLGKINQVLGALGIGLSVTAIVSFGKALLADADALVKLSDKTGITIEGLQRMQIAGDDAGNTIEQITSAVTMMEKRIAGGDRSALQGLEALNISFEDFSKLTPENKWNAIAAAIAGVEDPAKRILVATELFGRQGAEIIPSLLKSYEMLKDGAGGMSEETVRAFDEAGDTMARWWRTAKGVTSEAVVGLVHLVDAGFNPAIASAKKVTREMDNLYASMKKMIDAIPKAKIDIFDPSVELEGLEIDHVLRDLAADHDKLVAAQQRAAAASKKAAEDLQRHAEAARKVESGLVGLTGAVTASNDAELVFTRSYVAGTAAMASVERVVSSAQFGMAELANGIEKVGIHVNDLGPDIMHQFVGPMQEGEKTAESFSDTLKNNLSQSLSSLNGIFQSAFEGGGGIAGAVKSFATNALAGLTEMIPLVGPIISKFSGAIVAGFSKLFGGGEAKKTRDELQKFFDISGGVEQFKKDAAAAGIALDQLLGAKDRKHLQIAIENVNKALDEYNQKIDDANLDLADLLKTAQDIGIELPASFDPAIQKLIDMGRITSDNAGIFASLTGSTEVNFKKMQDVAQKYGIDLAKLGPQFQSAKLSDIAKNIINDFDTLTRGGADVDAVLAGMKKPINDIVNESLKFGIAIPANMKPWIDQLMLTGQLTDENGKKIEDISQLKFGDPIATQFEIILKKIGELIDKLTGPLTNAIKNIPNPTVDVTANVHWNVPDFPGGGSYASQGGMVTSQGVVQYLAGGGNVLPFIPRGTDRVPAMLTPGERVLSVEQNRAYEGGSGGAVMSAMLSEIASLRNDMAARDAKMRTFQKHILPKLNRAAGQLQQVG